MMFRYTCFFLMIFTAPGFAQTLAPHKAVYSIELIKRSPGAKILNITGDMSFSWNKRCDAYISDHGFDMRYDYTDEPSADILTQFQSTESFNHTLLDFKSVRSRNGRVVETLQGQASKGETGAGKAVYQTPTGLSFILKTNTEFPTEHTKTILNAIDTNKKFFAKTLFDGSDDQGPVTVNAVIGKPNNNTPETADAVDVDLLPVPYYPVRLAFFPQNSDSATAEYEMSLDMHKNGVISDVTIEYSDFSVRQSLKSLEKLSQTCDN